MDRAGLPAYPGARTKGQASNPDSKGGIQFSALLTTPDPLDNVVAYYRDKMNLKPSVKGDVTQFNGITSTAAIVSISIRRDGTETKITIRGNRYDNGRVLGTGSKP